MKEKNVIIDKPQIISNMFISATKVFDPFSYAVNYTVDLVAQEPSCLILCSSKKHIYSFKEKFREYNIQGNYRRLASYISDIYNTEFLSIGDIINFYYDHTFYHHSAYLNKRNVIYQCYLNYCAEREGVKYPYPLHESYEKFKQIFQDRSITDEVELITRCANDTEIQKKEIDTLVYVNSEDMTQSMAKAINKLFDYKRIILIGDSNRPNKYFIKPLISMKDSNIDLSPIKVVPKFFASKIERYATDFPYKVVSNDNKAYMRYMKFKDFNKVMLNITAKTDKTAKLILPSYDYQPQIEKYLFNNAIPFSTISDNYKFPTHLLSFYQSIRKVVMKDGMLTKEEINKVIDLTNPYITDRFGGKLKLKKMFYEYIYPAKILSKLNFFEVLKKLYLDEQLHYALMPKYSYEFVKWKGKLTEKFKNANTFVAPLLYCKNMPTDISILILDNQPKIYEQMMLYCCLTSTNEAIYIIRLPKNWED